MGNDIPISKTHSYSVSVAMDVGINATVVFQNICYWVEINRANERNFADGSYWTYNTVKALTKLFPEMTYEQVRNALRKLENANYIKSGCFNNKSADRTKWYTLVDAEKWIGKDEKEETETETAEPFVNKPNSNCENSQMELGKIPNANNTIYYNNTNQANNNHTNDNTDNSHKAHVSGKPDSMAHVVHSENAPAVGGEKKKRLTKKQQRRETALKLKEQQEETLVIVYKLCREMCGFNDEATAQNVEMFKYFYAKYREKTGKTHPIYPRDTLAKIIMVLNCGLDEPYGRYEYLKVATFDNDLYKDMIDVYFANDEYECDYCMSHFATNGILVNLAYKVVGV